MHGLALLPAAGKVGAMSSAMQPSRMAARASATAILALTGLALMLAAPVLTPAAAQPAPGTPPPAASPQTPPEAPEQPPPRRENPGLINEIGKLLEGRTPLFPALIPAQPDSEPPAASQPVPMQPAPALPAVAPSAPVPPVVGNAPAGGLQSPPSLGLKVPSMQKGREKCPVTSNGAADCKAAADTLCRAHGYNQGKSTDTDATEKCSAEALLLSGRKSQPGACRTEYFVTGAWCQ